MTSLDRALLAIAGVLHREGIPYMVIGGLANAVWGEPRATVDVDVMLKLEDDMIPEIISTRKSDFRILPENPMDFIGKTRVLPIETREGIRIDLIFVFIPFEEEAVRRAVSITIQGEPVAFCTPEDLILMKIISTRMQDQVDVDRLLDRRQDTLDLAYLKPRVEELALLLDKPEILKRLSRRIESAQ